MSEYALEVHGLSKQYKIGAQRNNDYSTLRDVLANRFGSLFRRSAAAHTPDPAENMIWALRDVSFNVKHGEVVGVIGRNGAGKSTLLKILSRITDPTEGTARVFGRVGALLEVGTGFHAELTGRENIYLNGAILGMSRSDIAKRFDEIVAFAEVEKFIDTPVKNYSSGMGLRLGFAVAAHLEPDILIVDEVLAVGDVNFQKKCLGKMGQVAGEGRTVLFVSHNMTAMQSLCLRAVLLDGGTAQFVGAIDDAVDRYLNISVEMIAERKWDDVAIAPGHRLAKLHRIQVSAVSGQATGKLSVTQALRIDVDFWSLGTNSQLHVALRVYTQDGILAFETGSYESETHGKPLPGGLYHTTCFIPENLLNNNVYSLDVTFVRAETEILCRLERIYSFEITEDVQSRPVASYGRWKGVLRPRLKWTMEPLSAGDAH